MATLPNLLNDNQNLRLEAYEAIKDVMFAIEKASVADDSNENTAYINLTTKEQDELTILLTVEGYKIMKGKHVGNCYETIEALLNEVSSSFPFSFASAVAEKLKKINKQE